MEETKNGQKIVAKNSMTTCVCGPGCTCGCGHYYTHRAFWWILGIVILGFVFCVGVKAGEFREELRGMFGGYYRGYPMMEHGGMYGGGIAVPVLDGAQGSATGSAVGTPTGL